MARQWRVARVGFPTYSRELLAPTDFLNVGTRVGTRAAHAPRARGSDHGASRRRALRLGERLLRGRRLLGRGGRGAAATRARSRDGGETRRSSRSRSRRRGDPRAAASAGEASAAPAAASRDAREPDARDPRGVDDEEREVLCAAVSDASAPPRHVPGINSGHIGPELAKLRAAQGEHAEYYTLEHYDRLYGRRRAWARDARGSKVWCKDVHGPGCRECTSCHFCRQKTTDVKTRCQCGEWRKAPPGGRGARVWCGWCLEMRMGENIAEALADDQWRCPVCRDICNCSGANCLRASATCSRRSSSRRGAAVRVRRGALPHHHAHTHERARAAPVLQLPRAQREQFQRRRAQIGGGGGDRGDGGRRAARAGRRRGGRARRRCARLWRDGSARRFLLLNSEGLEEERDQTRRVRRRGSRGSVRDRTRRAQSRDPTARSTREGTLRRRRRRALLLRV